jgi:hypothetical protein
MARPVDWNGMEWNGTEWNGMERAFIVGEGDKCREYAGSMQLVGA